MAKYLVNATYTSDGMQGILAKGGSARREAVEKAAADLGGRVESFYFAFGESDVVTVLELPDNVAAAAIGMAVGATGLVHTKTTVLLTTEEIDRAAHTQLTYRAPGQ